MDLALPDQIGDGWRPYHQLPGRHPALSVLGLEQHLSHDPLERLSEHRTHLVLLVRGKDIDDPVHRLGRGIRMQRSEHEVSGLGRCDPELDGFPVAHLPDQDHVRILAQRGPKRGGEALRIGTDLALIDQRLFVLVHELDRVLDGQDVIRPRFVDQVHHRRERRALPRPRGTRDENQTLAQHAHTSHRFGQPEIVCGKNFRRDRPKDRAEPLVLPEHVHAEAGESFDLVREVVVHSLHERDTPILLHDLIDEGFHVRILHFPELDPLQIPMHAHHRGRPHGQVEVGPPLLDEDL